MAAHRGAGSQRGGAVAVEEDAVVGACPQDDRRVARQAAIALEAQNALVVDVDGAVEHQATHRHALQRKGVGHVQGAVEGDPAQEVPGAGRRPELAATAGVDGTADDDAALQHGAAGTGNDLARRTARDIAAEHQRAAVQGAQRAVVGDSRVADADGAAGPVGADGAVVHQRLRAADVDLPADAPAVPAHGGAGGEGGDSIAVEVDAVAEATD